MALFGLRVWNLANVDTGEIIRGQFEPESTTKNVTANYARHTALNRQKAILQWLNGEADTISFQARLFARDSVFNNIQRDVEKLEEFTKRDESLGRPPVLFFWVGDGHLAMNCVLESLAGITYGRPTFFGFVKDVSLTINLLQHEFFDLSDKKIFETRFHRARVRDYYELLTHREYRNPLIGDVIRKRNPTKPNIQVGDLIALPSIEAIRTERVEQKSIPLQTAYGRKDTPQRRLRLEMFEKRDRTFVSHVILDD